MNKCEVCDEVMKPGLSYWGNYCSTSKCFNSELERVYKGPRHLREGVSK
jgi:hypothetical protein